MGVEKEPYSKKAYEAVKKQAEGGKSSKEKAEAYSKMAGLEEEAQEEAQEFDTRFTKARDKEQEAKKETEALRAEMGINPEEEQYKEALDQLRQEYGFSPEKEIRTYSIEIGGKTKDELVEELKNNNIAISKWAKDLLESKDFTTSEEAENIRLVELTVEDLGFPKGATFDEILEKAAKSKVLDKCPAETGPNLRLQTQDKKWKAVAMDPITGSDGYPSVFYLNSGGEQLKLDAYSAGSVSHCSSGGLLLCVLRKLES